MVISPSAGSREVRKELTGCRASGPTQLLRRTTLHVRYDFGDLLEVGRLAAFPAIRHGSKVRAIGFEHESVERRGCDSVANALRVLERDYAGKTNQRSHRHNALHIRRAAHKAVENPAHIAGERRHLRNDFLEGVALMNHAVQLQLGGQFQMLAEEG